MEIKRGKMNRSENSYNYLENILILPKSKRSQEIFGMSFGMIFSIILIIFFIVVAFIVINSFLNTQKCVQVGLFITDFKSEIKQAYNSPKEDAYFTEKLPTDIQYVCFSNLSNDITVSGNEKLIAEDISIWQGKDANMFFYPRNNACGVPYTLVDNLDINTIAGPDNLQCFQVKGGEVNIHVVKGLKDSLVTLS